MRGPSVQSRCLIRERRGNNDSSLGGEGQDENSPKKIRALNS